MQKKSLSEVLHSVDPHLTVVEGGRRYKRPDAPTGEKYYFRPSTMTEADWNQSAGVVCSGCGHEAFRSRDGLCMPCWEKANEYEVRDRAGVLNLLPASVILEIARPARKNAE